MSQQDAVYPNRNEQPQFDIKHIYLKDVSFEAPNAAEIFNKKWQPQASVDLHTQVQGLAANAFNVDLTVTLTVSLEGTEKKAYIAEVTQSGVFLVKNFSDEQLEHFLNVYCPTLLFPYLREAVANLVMKGGFAPFMLAPINFEAVYQQQKSQAAQ